MNQETNAGTQDAQQEKATQNKRSKSAGKNRPVLVTSSNDLAKTDQAVELMSDTTQPVEEVAPPTTIEVSRLRRFPKFFSSVGKNENDGTVEADQAAARIARATRNSGVSSASGRFGDGSFGHARHIFGSRLIFGKGSSLEQGSSSNSEKRLEVTVAGDEGSVRLDRVLAARCPEFSRSRLKALILAGQVSITQVSMIKAMVKTAPIRDPAYHVGPGDTIIIDVPEVAPAEPIAEAIALDIVYEDDDIIVIDKPAHLVVHPAAGHETGTLVNALIAHCGASLCGIGGVRRPGIVHRLDKDTTGLMVAAKNDRAHASLSAQFADHGRTLPMQRGYLAFVWGVPNRQRGTIDAPIDRHPHAREKMAVREGGREAVTHWEIRQTFNGRDGKPVASLLACRLETGRTHQIRVHLTHLGFPIAGDDKYGDFELNRALAKQGLKRMFLHAGELEFAHPLSGEALKLHAPLPQDLSRFLDSLEG